MVAEILGGWAGLECRDKSRKLGWSGFVDTKDGIRNPIEELAELKLVPSSKSGRLNNTIAIAVADFHLKNGAHNLRKCLFGTLQKM